jgi:peptidoglycan/LPS O-acetylase OafA/YrhL
LVVALLIAAPVVRYGLGAWANASGYDFFTSQQFVYWFPLSHFDAFACGGAATVLDRTGSVRRPGLWALALTMVIALCGLANLYSLRSAGIMLPVGTLGLQLAAQWNYQHVWSYTLINMWSAAMILALVDESGRRGLFTRFMASPVPVELGRVSYGMYVFHWPVWWLFLQSVRAVGWRAELLREWLFLPIFVLAVYVVGYASYELYETRFLNLKDRFFASSRTAVR